MVVANKAQASSSIVPSLPHKYIDINSQEDSSGVCTLVQSGNGVEKPGVLPGYREQISIDFLSISWRAIERLP